jgi:hypothetical protein
LQLPRNFALPAWFLVALPAISVGIAWLAAYMIASSVSHFRRPLVVLKKGFAAALCTGLLALGGPAMADEYRPDEFLRLDLSKAVLSPKPLGPPTHFAPVPVEAKADRGSEGTQAGTEPKADRQTVVHTESITPKVKQAHAERPRAAARTKELRAERPRATARAKLARRPSNPLDAQALDTRIQVWPCKSGGICNWKR